RLAPALPATELSSTGDFCRPGIDNCCQAACCRMHRRAAKSGTVLEPSRRNSETGAPPARPPERPAFAPQALRRVRRSFSGGGSGAGVPASEGVGGPRGRSPPDQKGDYGETNDRDAERDGRGHRRTWVREVPADQGGDGRVRLLPAAS